MVTDSQVKFLSRTFVRKRFRWLQEEIQHRVTFRSVIALLLVLVWALVAGKMLLIFLAGTKKFMMIAFAIMFAPFYVLIPEKEKFIMVLFIFATSIGMGYLVLNEYTNTVPPARHLFRIILSDLLLVVLFGFRLYRIFAAKTEGDYSFWKDNRLLLPILLWVGMGVMSYIPAKDSFAVTLQLFNLARYFLTFYVIFCYIRSREDMNFILACLVVSILGQAPLLIAQFAAGDVLVNIPGISNEKADVIDGAVGYRPGGTMGHSSHYGLWSGLVMPLALAYAFFAPQKIYKLAALTIWLSGSLALILTVSRAGLGAWAMALIGFPAGMTVLRILPMRLLLPVFALYLLFAIGIVGLLFAVGGDRFMERSKHDGGSASTRPLMWQVARNMIKANPTMGVGLGNYILVHRQYDDTIKRISIILATSPVHQLFLLYAAEIGIPGLVGFVWFVGMLAVNAFICATQEKSRLYKALYLAIILGIAGFLFQSIYGKGARDHIVHLSVVCIYAGCVANVRKQREILNLK